MGWRGMEESETALGSADVKDGEGMVWLHGLPLRIGEGIGTQEVASALTNLIPSRRPRRSVSLQLLRSLSGGIRGALPSSLRVKSRPGRSQSLQETRQADQGGDGEREGRDEESKRAPDLVERQLTGEEVVYATFQRERKTRRAHQVPSERCEACLRFDVVCSACFMRERSRMAAAREKEVVAFRAMNIEARPGVLVDVAARGDEETMSALLGAADVDTAACSAALLAACRSGGVDVVRTLLLRSVELPHPHTLDSVACLAPDEDAVHDLRLLWRLHVECAE
eukprot:Hpha_TRINITY_DN16778_c4_g4::TRINITY_DN16778_c4_g4_i1::g.77575::m.77575